MFTVFGGTCPACANFFFIAPSHPKIESGDITRHRATRRRVCVFLTPSRVTNYIKLYKVDGVNLSNRTEHTCHIPHQL